MYVAVITFKDVNQKDRSGFFCLSHNLHPLSLLVLLPPVAVAAPPVAVAVPPVAVTITVTFPVEPKTELSREVLSASNCPDTRPKPGKRKGVYGIIVSEGQPEMKPGGITKHVVYLQVRLKSIMI